MEVRFKNFVTIHGSYTQQGLSNHITFMPIKSGATVPLIHCTENRIHKFPEKELRGLSPNSYIHVSVSNLYIPRIDPHIWLQQKRQADPGNI